MTILLCPVSCLCFHFSLQNSHHWELTWWKGSQLRFSNATCGSGHLCCKYHIFVNSKLSLFDFPRGPGSSHSLLAASSTFSKVILLPHLGCIAAPVLSFLTKEERLYSYWIPMGYMVKQNQVWKSSAKLNESYPNHKGHISICCLSLWI